VEDLKLKSGCLYLMSAPPSSGKSTFLNLNKDNLPKGSIISSDEIRHRIIGSIYSHDENGVSTNPIESSNEIIFEIIHNMVRARLSNGLTTVIDAKFTKESDRNSFAKIASEYGIETIVLFIKKDLNTLVESNSKREKRICSKAIISNYENHEFETSYKSIFINSDDIVNIENNELKTNKIDVVGDTHGMLNEALMMISRLGYDRDFVHTFDPERKILFLGDFVDRGNYSLETLFLIKKLNLMGHYAILGNHENKLINFYKSYKKGLNLGLAVAPSITASEFMKLSLEKREDIFNWLLKLPSYFIYNSKTNSNFKVVFTHANIRSFDDKNIVKSSNLYGDTFDKRVRMDTDLIYSNLYDLGINEYRLIRGHIPSTNKEQNNVISVEDHICFGGDLLALKLDDLENQFSKTGKFNDSEMFYRVHVDFNFDDFVKNNKEMNLYFNLKNLVKEKLAVSRKDESGLLQIFKYSKKVFFDRKWKDNHDLMQCRGIVFDFAGNLVQMPFDKVFNYSEPNEKNIPTAVDYDNKNVVKVVDKLNGFLGCITLHPFKRELLITTSGSFDSDFINYIKDLIKKNNHYSNLVKYFFENPNITLMFEVIHSEDPHIIKYEEDEFDIYLIGARDKKIDSKLFSEEELDRVGDKLNIKRPYHQNMIFSDAKKLVKDSEIEGYMIRDLDSGDVICKMKSPYYLVTKFFGRLSINNTKMMYGNRDAFKKKVDEEFFDIVDHIVDNKEMNEFINMEGMDKINFVRNFIIENIK
jgi:predicted kinase